MKNNRRDRRAEKQAFLKFGQGISGLSRRAFLATTGSAVTSAAYANELIGFENPRITFRSGVLTVFSGDYSWQLSAKSFSPRSGTPVITHFEDKVLNEHRVELQYAGIPGTNLRFNLKFRIFNPGNGWRIEFRLNDSPPFGGGQEILVPLLVDWISGASIVEFSAPQAIPSIIHVGGRQIDSVQAGVQPKLTLRLIEVEAEDEDHNEGELAARGERLRERKLQAVITGPLQVHLWFPGNKLANGRATRITFSRAAIDFYPNSQGSLSNELVFPVDSFGSHPELKQTSALLAAPHSVVSFQEWKTSAEGIPIGAIDSDSSIAQSGRNYLLNWIPIGKSGLFGMLAFETQSGKPESLVHLGSKAAVRISGPGAHSQGSFLRFECSQILGLASKIHYFTILNAEFNTDPNAESNTLFETSHTAFVISGRKSPEEITNEEIPIRLECRRDQMKRVSIPIRLRHAHVPVAGASLSVIDLHSVDANILFGECPSLSDGHLLAPVIHFGTACKFLTPLQSARMRLKRSVDNFDMSFEFRSYWMESVNGKTRLDRRIPEKLRANCITPILVAVFPPQHVREEVFTTGVGGNIRSIKDLKTPDELARASISGETRIAMQGVGDTPDRQEFDLTIESLTDWHDLALAVHRRALPRDSDLRSQLQAVGLSESDSREAARTHWRDSMLELGNVARSSEFKFQTQIEAVSGLIVSPVANATFETPRSLRNYSGRIPLWTAKLVSKWHGNKPDQNRDTAVRVIHSRHTNLDFFEKTGCQEGSGYSPFIASLSARDRTELLVLTSGFGLPSLRRLVSSEANALNDDPKGMVIRPDNAKQMRFLSSDTQNYEGHDVFQEGILIPRPFKNFELTLSSLRACLRSSWEGEPPAPYIPKTGSKDRKFYADALSVQGYTHNVHYGRDVFVQIAYKGYLGFLGHRAAFIKTTERTFLPARKNDEGLDPTAYEIKRSMIVCQSPIKAFPALGQPYAGREFPASSIEIVTTVTPEIIDPEDYPDQYIPDVGTQENGPSLCGGEMQNVGRCFWPRTAPVEKGTSGNEVLFELRIDGSTSTVKVPLIFVDNAAAHNSKTMEDLVKYYNTDAEERLRTATHSGVVRKYAPSLQSGDTNFVTDKWILNATGRGGNDDFKMDALMEGADQPPFYPLVKRAYIKLQSLDRLLGRSHGFIETAFNSLYVKHALDTTGNPSEIYLDVIQPSIDLNCSSQGQSIGGVAQPNARLAAISRKTGMIGGRPIAGSGNKMRVQESDHQTFDISKAEEGNFDPAEFLGGSIGEAKLLGILPLRDVVRVVAMNLGPQLKELEEFASDAAEDARKIAAEFSKILASARETATKNINNAIGAVNDTEGAVKLDPIATYYPELAQRLIDLEIVFDQINQAKDALNIAPLIKRMINAAKSLFHAIEDTARNPLPAGFQEYMTEVERLMKVFSPEELKKFISGTAVDGLNNLLKKMVKEEFPFIRKVITKIFGTTSIQDVLQHPREAVQDLRQTVFLEAYAQPLLSALSTVTDLKNAALGRITWSRDRIARNIASVLFDGNADLVGRIFNIPLAEVGDEKQESRILQFSVSDQNWSKRLNDFVDAIDELATTPFGDELQKANGKIEEVVDKHVKEVASKVVNGINSHLSDFVKGANKATEVLLEALKGDATIKQNEIDKVLTSAVARAKMYEELLFIQSQIAAVEREIKTMQITILDLTSHAPKLRDRIIDVVTAELRRSVQKLADEINSLARKSLEDVLARLLHGVKGLVDFARPLAAFVVLAKEIDPTAHLRHLKGYYTNALDIAGDQLSGLLSELVSIRLSEEAGDGVRCRLALLRASATRFLMKVSEVKGAFAKFSSSVDNLLSEYASGNRQQSTADTVMRNLNLLLRHRSQLSSELRNILCDFVETVDSLQTLPENVAKDVKNALRGPLNQRLVPVVKEFLTGAMEIEDTVLKKYNDYGLKLGSAVVAFETAKKEVLQVLESVLPDKIHVIGSGPNSFASNSADFSNAFDLINKAFATEAKMVGVLTSQLAAVGDMAVGLETEMKSLLTDIASKIITPLIALHTDALVGVGTLLTFLAGTKGAELIAAISDQGKRSLEHAEKIIDGDKTAITEVETAIKKSDLNEFTKKCATLATNWDGKEPGLVQAGRILARLAESLMRGQLASLFDFSQLRQILEEKLLELVPTRFAQSYDWDTSIDNFPTSDPIFLIDRSIKGLEKRLEGKFTNDLVLEARVEVDLRTKTRRATAGGRIAPFSIRLMGSRLDLITIHFCGATFRAGPDGKSSYEVLVREVEIGKQIEFIKALQDYFSPPGSGPYITLQASPPSIEAGYRFSAPLIQMGSLNFENVSISVAMLLPFDQQPAIFKFALASRDNPFLISNFPYGGGGFVSLTANARGIIGFEIQFEFGGYAKVEYGPMKGHGRISAGIYLMTLKSANVNQQVIEGFVKATGSGQIACFGMSINMEIRVRQENGGDMVGSSTYGFTFSLGLFDYDYVVTATNRISGNNKSGLVEPSEVKMLGEKDSIVDSTPKIVLASVAKHRNWQSYRSHLALK